MNTYSISLFIFRRDLRLNDNTALNEALGFSDQVIPSFIFDPRQIDTHPYQSKPGLQFMLESLSDLQQQLISPGGNLALYHALPEQIISRLHEVHQIQAIFINRDYTPFSRRRDNELYNVCKQACTHYKDTRDFPALNATSKLSGLCRKFFRNQRHNRI